MLGSIQRERISRIRGTVAVRVPCVRVCVCSVDDDDDVAAGGSSEREQRRM